MTRPARCAASALLLALVAACGSPEPAPAPEQTTASAAADGAVAPDSAGAPTGASVPVVSDPAAAASQPGGASIPEALQGRWGLVRADCTSDRGDAKGLVIVGPDTLRFYESTARAGTVSDMSSRRIRASFAFSGEGSVWTREMLLEASDDGKSLTRRDYGGEAGPEPLTYTRC